MNKLFIIGNLTRDPELRTMPDGRSVCNFTVAVNRVVRGQKITEYFRVSCWEKQADNAMKYLAKGRKVAVTGPVTGRAYMGSDGQPKVSLEIQRPEEIEYLSGKPEGGQETEAAPPDDGYMPVDDEDTPF